MEHYPILAEFKFTIHFATINTWKRTILFSLILSFTIHFATINTKAGEVSAIDHKTFTIHFATINTIQISDKIRNRDNLQYTLLLLIQ